MTVENEESQTVEEQPKTPTAEAEEKTLEDSQPTAENDAVNKKEDNTSSVSSWFPSASTLTSWIPTGEKKTSSAGASENPTQGSSWGTTWLLSAKEKTLETLEFMKKDLNEFSDTVQQEAYSLASAAANSVKKPAHYLQQQFNHSEATDNVNEGEPVPDNKKDDNEEPNTPKATDSHQGSVDLFGASRWVKSIVETVQRMSIEDTTKDEEDFTEELRAGLPRKTNLDQLQLLMIQNDEHTFLQPPSENIDLYREWLLEFKIAEYNGEINILLGYNPKLREIYARLVPSKVDNHTFWNRYFFKVHVQELDKDIAEEAKKAQAAKRTSTVNNNENNSGERDETWSLCSSANNDMQELDDESTECTEEERIRRQERDSLKTPQLEKSSLDEWEECAENGIENLASHY